LAEEDNMALGYFWFVSFEPSSNWEIQRTNYILCHISKQ